MTVFVISFVACSDQVTRPVALTSLDSTITDSATARAVLARVNPHAWVGVAHNDAIRATQRTYAERRLPGTDSCRELPLHALVAAAPADRRGIGTHPGDVAHFAAAGLAVSRCAPQGTVASVNPFADLSPRAAALASAISSAMDRTSTPGAFAVALVPLVAEASTLAEPERSVLLAAASVAQHSVEYWHINWTAFTEAVEEQYGPCPASRSFDECTGGMARRATEGDVATAARTAASCARINFLENVADLGAADFSGAILGGFAGFVRSGFSGVALGAFIGGASASLGAALSHAPEYAWCG